MEFMTANEAARELGVTNAHITYLTKKNLLEYKRIGEKNLLIDSKSVIEYKTNRIPRGRAFSKQTAWNTLALLSDQKEVTELSYFQKRRIVLFLSNCSVDELIAKSRNRAKIIHMNIDSSFWGVISNFGFRTRAEALPTEQNSILINAKEQDYYVPKNKFNKLCDSTFSQEETLAKSNVTIRLFDDSEFRTIEFLPKALIAVDMSQSLNSRERNEGRIILKEMLNDFRKNN
jgi:hypothetical protein